MRKIAALLVLMPCLVLAPWQASAAGFAAIDMTVSHIKSKNTTGSVDINAMQFRFGTGLNETATLAAEFRAGIGFSGDSDKGVRYDLDRYFGAYFRGQFPNRLPLRPYGLIGVTRTEIELNRSGESYSDLSLGFGADYTINPDVFVSMEYLRAVNRSKAEVSNFSIGIGARF